MAPDAASQERLYHQIKLDLLAGRFPPGRRIEMATLADRFRTSPTPVRDAMHRLVGERLLDPYPDGGFQLAVPDEGRLLHLYRWNAHHILAALHLAPEDALDHFVEPLLGTAVSDHAEQQAALVAHLFHKIGEATANMEFSDQIEAANHRLQNVRFAEAHCLRNTRRELSALLHPVQNNLCATLRRRIWGYHRRRFEHVGIIAQRCRLDAR